MKEKLRKDKSSKKDGINNNTYDLLFKDYKKIKAEERNTKQNEKAFVTIDYFTRTKKNKLLAFSAKLLKKVGIDFDKITYDEENKEYVYEDNDLIIRFDLISNGFKKEKETEDIINELTSKKRKGRCHNRSIQFARSFEGSKVVTGYITFADSKILHTFVECNSKKNEKIVLDWTLNLKVKKEDYVKLTKFEELNSIPSEKINDEIDLIYKNLDMSIKSTVLFWDEIVMDLKRNEHILKNEEENKKIKR